MWANSTQFRCHQQHYQPISKLTLVQVKCYNNFNDIEAAAILLTGKAKELFLTIQLGFTSDEDNIGRWFVGVEMDLRAGLAAATKAFDDMGTWIP
ncbi:hypothetical protein ACLOJK_037381 [Asimina triloba]